MNDKKCVPTKLEVLEIMTKRSFYPNQNKLSELNRLRAGNEGEKVVVDYLKRYGKSHWVMMRNFWLDYFGTLECDGLLFTGRDLYVLEIKNYAGLYEYENGLSKLNDRELSVNPIYQTQKATMKVRELVSSRFSNIKVHGVLIFVGVDSQIRIKSEVSDIRILQRHELRGFIEGIVKEERNVWLSSADTTKVVDLIRQHKTEHPYPVAPLSAEISEGLLKGILCDNCAKSSVMVTKKYVKCSCGYVECREKATIRTICEYGVLNFEKPLTINTVTEFFDGQASKGYVFKLFKKYFKLLSRGKEDYYQNNFHLYADKYSCRSNCD